MLEIIKYPDPRLKQKSVPVIHFDQKLHALLEDMAQTMYEADGIGLAAVQVNQHLRMFIIDLGGEDGQRKKKWEFINPKISNGEGKTVYEEGCLSVPGLTEEVTRKERITIDYQDRKGKLRKLEAEGLFAVAIQHENDHLDGIVFIERLSPIKRRLAKRKLSKQVTL